MAEDFTDRELAIIGQIVRAEKTMPDEFWGVEVVQELACIMARYMEHFSDEDYAELLGVGAWIVRHARDETMAGIKAAIGLRNLGFGAPPAGDAS